MNGSRIHRATSFRSDLPTIYTLELIDQHRAKKNLRTENKIIDKIELLDRSNSVKLAIRKTKSTHTWPSDPKTNLTDRVIQDTLTFALGDLNSDHEEQKMGLII